MSSIFKSSYAAAEPSDELSGCLVGCFALIGAVILLPLMSVISAITTGVVVKTLWGWFIVKTFHLAPLNFIESIGLSYVVGFLTHQTHESPKSKDKSTVWATIWRSFLGHVILRPAIYLLCGWILMRFM